MTVQTKFVLAIYVMPLGGFIICAAMGGKPLGLAFFIGSIIWHAYVTHMTRCPKCGKRVTSGVLVPSKPHFEWGIPVDCKNCGFPFKL
jgi:hypothetical protein